MNQRLLQFLLAVLVTCALVEHSHALDPPYLEGWPTAEQVLQDARGQEELDTMARQMAALELLRRAVENLAGPRLWRGLTPDEERLRGEYWTASKKIETQAQSRLSNELGPGFHEPFAKSQPARRGRPAHGACFPDEEDREAGRGRRLTGLTGSGSAS